MILLLPFAVMSLLGGTTHASEMKLPPLYIESNREIQESIRTIKDNILSMDGKIPPLNDTRRSYVEITNVIYLLGMALGHSCLKGDFDTEYQNAVNIGLPEALATPQKVVDTAKTFLNTFDEKTLEIQKLARDVAHIPDDVLANKLIESIVDADPKKYKLEVELLFAAGESAKKFNEMKYTFHEVAKTMLSHKYIIKGSKDLKPVILAMVKTLDLVYPDYVGC